MSDCKGLDNQTCQLLPEEWRRVYIEVMNDPTGRTQLPRHIDLFINKAHRLDLTSLYPILCPKSHCTDQDYLERVRTYLINGQFDQGISNSCDPAMEQRYDESKPQCETRVRSQRQSLLNVITMPWLSTYQRFSCVKQLQDQLNITPPALNELIWAVDELFTTPQQLAHRNSLIKQVYDFWDDCTTQAMDAVGHATRGMVPNMSADALTKSLLSVVETSQKQTLANGWSAKIEPVQKAINEARTKLYQGELQRLKQDWPRAREQVITDACKTFALPQYCSARLMQFSEPPELSASMNPHYFRLAIADHEERLYMIKAYAPWLPQKFELGDVYASRGMALLENLLSYETDFFTFSLMKTCGLRMGSPPEPFSDVDRNVIRMTTDMLLKIEATKPWLERMPEKQVCYQAMIRLALHKENQQRTTDGFNYGRWMELNYRFVFHYSAMSPAERLELAEMQANIGHQSEPHPELFYKQVPPQP